MTSYLTQTGDHLNSFSLKRRLATNGPVVCDCKQEASPEGSSQKGPAVFRRHLGCPVDISAVDKHLEVGGMGVESMRRGSCGDEMVVVQGMVLKEP